MLSFVRGATCNDAEPLMLCFVRISITSGRPGRSVPSASAWLDCMAAITAARSQAHAAGKRRAFPRASLQPLPSLTTVPSISDIRFESEPSDLVSIVMVGVISEFPGRRG